MFSNLKLQLESIGTDVHKSWGLQVHLISKLIQVGHKFQSKGNYPAYSQYKTEVRSS